MIELLCEAFHSGENFMADSLHPPRPHVLTLPRECCARPPVRCRGTEHFGLVLLLRLSDRLRRACEGVRASMLMRRLFKAAFPL